MICKKCNADISDSAKFCPKCGAKVEMPKAQNGTTKKCPSCGAENPIATKFCKVDGYRFEAAESKPPDSPIEPTPEKPKEEIICPKCGFSNPPAAKFCKKDGTPLQKSATVPAEPIEKKIQTVDPTKARPEVVMEYEPKSKPSEVPEEQSEQQKDTIICPKCGTPNPATTKFCKKDGTPLAKKAEAQPAVVQQPEPVLAAEREIQESSIEEPEIITERIPRPRATTEEPVPAQEIHAKPAQPDSSVICPKCGTPNLPTAKFCKKDGAPLAERQVEQVAAPEKPAAEAVVERQPKEKAAQKRATTLQPVSERRSKTWIWVAVACVVVAAIGAGGYFYFARIKKEIVSELGGTPASETPQPPEANPGKDPFPEDPTAAAAQEIEDLKKAIAQCRTDVGRFPTTTEGVSALLEDPGVIGWNGPYLSSGEARTDPWGRPYGYEYPGKHGDYDLYSYGGDGLPGGQGESADIVSWHVPSPEERPMEEHPSEVKQPATPQPEPPAVDMAQIERSLNRDFRSNGLTGIYAEINNDLSATLKGSVSTENDKRRAIDIALSHVELKGVRTFIEIKPQAPPPHPPSVPDAQVDPAKLEGEINRVLRNEGLTGVTAAVSDDLQVTLKGSVQRPEQKSRAFAIVREFKEIKRVKDVIFVVEE